MGGELAWLGGVRLLHKPPRTVEGLDHDLFGVTKESPSTTLLEAQSFHSMDDEPLPLDPEEAASDLTADYSLLFTNKSRWGCFLSSLFPRVF